MAIREAKVPDIGNYTNVPVIEVLVKAGDTVGKDQGLVTLESDKATMEVPAPFDGVVKEVKVKVGDDVSEGAVVAIIEAAEAASPPENKKEAAPSPPAAPAQVPEARTDTSPATAPPQKPASPAEAKSQPAQSISDASGVDPEAAGPRTPPVPFDASTVMPDKVPYASPAVRLFARELGVDLHRIEGSERKGRISKDDVRKFVKAALAGGAAPRAASGGAVGGGLNVLPWPQIDFAKFGEI
jgi:pyruvate dehydrogenase E2 component (dihydrolipoamide acetyltransferase)